MADRYSYWVHEQHPDHRGPTSSKVLALALVAVVVAVVLQLSAATGSGGHDDRDPARPRTPPACAQHFPPTCKEGSRGR